MLKAIGQRKRSNFRALIHSLSYDLTIIASLLIGKSLIKRQQVTIPCTTGTDKVCNLESNTSFSPYFRIFQCLVFALTHLKFYSFEECFLWHLLNRFLWIRMNIFIPEVLLHRHLEWCTLKIKMENSNISGQSTSETC